MCVEAVDPASPAAIEPEAFRAYLAPFVLHPFYVDVFGP